MSSPETSTETAQAVWQMCSGGRLEVGNSETASRTDSAHMHVRHIKWVDRLNDLL